MVRVLSREGEKRPLAATPDAFLDGVVGCRILIDGCVRQMRVAAWLELGVAALLGLRFGRGSAVGAVGGVQRRALHIGYILVGTGSTAHHACMQLLHCTATWPVQLLLVMFHSNHLRYSTCANDSTSTARGAYLFSKSLKSYFWVANRTRQSW